MPFGIVDSYANGIDPPKNGGISNDPSPVKLIVAPEIDNITGNFVAPLPGRYQFVVFGRGGYGDAGSGAKRGGPGALAIRTFRMAKGQSVPYAVGAGTLWSPIAISSTVTFPDRTLTAGFGTDAFNDGAGNYTAGTGGTASGGDINLNGITGAAQAPSYGAFIGGVTGFIAPGSALRPATAPGGPGAPLDSLGGLQDSGGGRLIVTFLGP